MSDALFGIHGDALALRSRRLELIASNIANAATPHYRARDLDFDAALAAASNGDSVDHAARGASGWRTPLNPSLDGNTVELPVEQTLFAENAIGYRTSLAFLEGRVATITRALKGE
jgi:flagellar basal-body rod protein FlgB